MDGKKGDDGLDDIAKKINYLCAQTDDLKKALQEIIHAKQNERSIREIKDTVNEPRGAYEHPNGNRAPEGGNVVIETQLSPKTSRWQTQDTRVHPTRTESGKRFIQAAKRVSSHRSLTSHIAGLKETRPQPERLGTQYDNAMEHVYMKEWPDVVPEYKNKHKCCRRDSERDNDTRGILKKVFPCYLFYFLVFAGAIPTQYEPCHHFLRVLWRLFGILHIILLLGSIFMFAVNLSCINDPTCQTFNAELDINTIVGVSLTEISTIMSIFLVHGHLRDLLQSRELLTLVCVAGPARLGRPRCYWIILFVFYCVLTFTAILFGLVKGSGTSDSGHFYFIVPLALSLAPPFAFVLYFFLVTHAISLCYDDWTTKMLVVTSTPARNRAESRLVQLNLLDKLKARVALSALTTRETRLLLLLTPVLALFGAVFGVLAFVINPTSERASHILEMFIFYTVMQVIPLFFPFFVSSRMSILENLVAQANLRKITDYLDYAPKEWMLGQKMSFNFAMLAKVGLLTGMLGVVASYIDSTRKANTMPWDDTYNHFGSCGDGIRSGLEQYVDCGGPESSCPQTCREKYGEYILIPADRECEDVDGYVHITTQRACTTAYNTWARSQNRTLTTTPSVVFGGVLSESGVWKPATWTKGFRCGAYNQPTSSFLGQEMSFFSFPALFSPWNTSAAFPEGKNPQKSHAYLCYAKRARSCEATTAYDKDNSRFEEMMACPGFDARRELPDSAWRHISSPLLPALSNDDVVTFSAGRGSDGDCAEIQLDNEGTGAQVLFALECNVGACPKDNRVRISVEAESRLVVRETILVFSSKNMTNITESYPLGESGTINVNPGSTLVFVADYDSYSFTSVTLCF